MGNIQIRNVPPELHRKLKSRAAERGMTLSDYLLDEAERLAAAPTPEEIKERLRLLPRARLAEPPSATLRRIRDAQ
jgi:plasmid stability protein